MFVNKFIYVPYQQWEYTRLVKVRELMDSHMSYNKEKLFKPEKSENDVKEETPKKERFIWSYILRP